MANKVAGFFCGVFSRLVLVLLISVLVCQGDSSVLSVWKLFVNILFHFLKFFFLVQNKALSSARQAALFKHLGTTASHNIYRLLVFLIWNLTICWAVLCTNDYEVRTCLAYCRGFYCWIFCLFLFLREIYCCKGIIEFFCFQFPCRNSLRKTFLLFKLTTLVGLKKVLLFYLWRFHFS